MEKGPTSRLGVQNGKPLKNEKTGEKRVEKQSQEYLCKVLSFFKTTITEAQLAGM